MTREMKELLRRVDEVRNKAFPHCTCPASRHVHQIADTLAAKKPYLMLQQEPEHCAESMLYVLLSLWMTRMELKQRERTTPTDNDIVALVAHMLDATADGEGPGGSPSRAELFSLCSQAAELIEAMRPDLKEAINRALPQRLLEEYTQKQQEQ